MFLLTPMLSLALDQRQMYNLSTLAGSKTYGTGLLSIDYTQLFCVMES